MIKELNYVAQGTLKAFYTGRRGKASSINVTYTGHRLCHKNRASESKDGHLLKATKYRIMNDTDPDDKLSGGKNCRYEQENEVCHLTLQLGWGSQGD